MHLMRLKEVPRFTAIASGAGSLLASIVGVALTLHAEGTTPSPSKSQHRGHATPTELTGSATTGASQALGMPTGFEVNIKSFPRNFVDGRFIDSELIITRAGKGVFSLRGNSLKIGPRSDDKRQAAILAANPDLNGDKIPDLVITEQSGGKGCCLAVHLFQLHRSGPESSAVKEWGTIDARFDEEVNFVVFKERPGEIFYRTKDYTFGGWGSKDFSRPAPEVVLKLTPQGPRLSPELMRVDPPSSEQLEEVAKQIREEMQKEPVSHSGEDLPALLTGSVLGLLYGGNGEVIPNFLRSLWPAGRPGAEKFWERVKEQLARSPYFKELKPLLPKA